MLPVIQFTDIRDLLEDKVTEDVLASIEADASEPSPLYAQLIDIEVRANKDYGISGRLVCTVIRFIGSDHISSLTLPHFRYQRVGSSPMIEQSELDSKWNRAEALHDGVLDTIRDGYAVRSGVIDIGNTSPILGSWPAKVKAQSG